MLKQIEVLRQLDAAIQKEGIQIEINKIPDGGFGQTTYAFDVEHDESGGFVGCGLYGGSGPVLYFNNISILNGVPFHSLALIAHNGVTDIECLNMWGIDVNYKQLVWDTMLIGHILDSSEKSYSLKDMAKRHLQIEYLSYDDIVGKRGLKTERVTLDKQPIEIVSKYNALDCYATWKLKERQELK